MAITEWCFRDVYEHADAVHALALLRPSHDRPRHRAAC
jgi:hypothetical protein